MELIKLFKSESSKAFKLIILMAVVSGAANGALVGLINAGAMAVHSETVATRDFILFVVGLVLYLYSKDISENRGKQVMELAMSKQRLRIYEKIQNASLSTIEALNPSEVIAKTARNISQILQSSDSVIYGMQSLMMLVFCSIYLFIISAAAFLVVMAGVGLLIFLRYMRDSTNKQQLDELIVREGRQSGYMADMIEGFKEIKINHAKCEDLFATFNAAVQDARALSMKTAVQYIRFRIVMQASFYIILAVVVFMLPRFIDTYSRQVMESTSVVLFIVGYLSGFVEIIPVFARSNAALKNMAALEAQLDAAVELRPETLDLFPGFQTISARDMHFAYQDQSGEKAFSVGPLNLEVQRGEILFLTGGNGSGKSTLLKLLTGLYRPDAGAITVDGVAVNQASVFALREMYSAIFTDFHLFDRFYGYHDVDAARINALIHDLGLEQKVSFADGAFSTLKLSTGQRKRLALIITLIEDRQIYVFDEWAADQDQRFRRHFYEVILPELKQRGKTVIAVTHDDAYWGHADRLVKLDGGTVVGDAYAAPASRERSAGNAI